MSSIESQITRRPGDGKFRAEIHDAHHGGYSTYTYERIREGISNGSLVVPATRGRGYRLDVDRGGIGEAESNLEKRRLLRAVKPEVYTYIQKMGDAFADRFDASFEVTSLSRTQEYYRKMSGAKSSTGKSSHKYATSFDIAHLRLSDEQRRWLYRYAAQSQSRGEVSVAREGRHALHVFVIPSTLVRQANQATDRFLDTKGLDVEDLQRRLKQKGYYQGEIDGELGRLSFQAIRSYQKRVFGTRYAHLYDGIVGPGTYRKLFGNTTQNASIPAWKVAQGDTLQFLGDQNISSQEVQSQLKAAGVFHEKVNGVIGPATHAAIRRFQSQHGLAVDGVVGPKTWSLLKNNA